MPLLNDDDVTDISYSNNGQLWVKTLSSGVKPTHIDGLTNEVIEKLAFQCSNVMGKTFNMAHPFLDAESAELRMNFVHDSIATNGIACLIRKTPAKIRLNKEKLLNEQYITDQMHDFLKNTKEKISCRKGLWNYSRHPNYLGELSIWVGTFVTMVAVVLNYWYYIFGMILMICLFLFISIPLAEKRQLKRRSDYVDYKKHTSMLFLFPHKK